MHPNPAFAREERQRNISFLRDRAFGTLAINGPDGPLTAHVPFLLDTSGDTAELHLVRSTAIARAIRSDASCVITVTGPDSYVSPDWYGVADQVPTWNYVAICLRGQLVPMPHDDLHAVLDRLFEHFERRLLPKHPWHSNKMPDGAMEKMMKSILPFQIDVTSIEGRWELGQNKPDAARRSGADGIAAYGQGQEIATLAALMRGA
ncbi:MAG: FMN-binding negative transcriptional regulator [Pseudomonadota bacterium]